MLHDEIRQYNKNKFKVWIITFIGLTIGCICAPTLVLILRYFGGLSLFDRTGLDKACKENLGENDWSNIIQDDLLIPSYEYDSK